MPSRRQFIHATAAVGRGARGSGNVQSHGSVQANHCRRAGPSVEGGVRGLEMGPGPEAAAAGAVHHRQARADDGRGRRRPRRGGAAVMARRPQRLCARSRQALSQPLCRDGPHRAGEAGIGRAAAEVEGAARHARHPAHLPARAGRRCCSTPTGFSRRPRRPMSPLMFFAPDNLPRFAPIAEKHPG